MRKLSLLALAVLALMMVSTASAQMKTEFGLKAGVNLANVTGDVEETKMLIGFGGGVFAKLMPSPQFAIQPEVLFMLKGAEEDVEDGDKIKLSYIEVPILIKYMIPTEGKISPCIFAGPMVGMLMSAKWGDEDIKDSLKSIDFGVAFGAGIDMAVGEKGKMTFDARYTLGMSNINDADDADEYEIKNAVISVMVGYAFPMGE